MAAWAVAVAVALVAMGLSLLPLLTPMPAHAAISHVQTNSSYDTSGGASDSLAFSSNNTAGNTIIVAVGSGDMYGDHMSCSDSQNNVYQTTGYTKWDYLDVGGDPVGLFVAVCYATNIAAGANTVTATFQFGAAGRAIAVSEYSGIAKSHPLDVISENAGSVAGGTDAITSGSATTTSNGNLIYGAIFTDTAHTAGTGFQERAAVDQTLDLRVEDKTQASAGSVAATWSGSGANMAAQMVTFRPEGATSPSTPSVNSGDGLMLYSELNAHLASRTYDGVTNTFGSEARTTLPAWGEQPVVKTSPLRREAIAVYRSYSYGALIVACYDGTRWTHEWSVNITATGNGRAFDVAYETATGDVMVLYGTNTATTNELAYRTRLGSTGCGGGNWSAATNLDPVRTSNIVKWVKLAWDRRATSNLITAVYTDLNLDLSAMQWSGTAWGNEPASALETSLEVHVSAGDADNIDVEYESTSGDVLVAWGNSAGGDGTNGARYATCTGGTSSCTWSATTTPPTFLDDVHTLDISSNPISDEMVFASIGDAGDDLQLGYWSGSAWTNTANVDTGAQSPGGTTKRVATGWLVVGPVARSVVVYNQSAQTNVGWYVGNGSTFTLQTDFTPTPAFGNPQIWYDIKADPIRTDRLMFTIRDTASDLFSKRLVMDGAAAFTWTNADGGAALETSNGSSQFSPYSFAYWRNPAKSQLTQSGYIFENDDEDQASGDAVDENTQRAAGNTALTNVAKGQRVTLRTQVSNSGAPATSDLGLFYDRNDGMWSRVGEADDPLTGSGSCDNTSWDCTAVTTSSTTGWYASIAIDPNGVPWVVHHDEGAGDLIVSHYLGVGGSGCASTAWTCDTVDNTVTDVGAHPSIAFSPTGKIWISYYVTTGGNLKVAEYVGTSGSGCAMPGGAWTCTSVDTTNDVGYGSAIAFDPAGSPWISYWDVTNSALRVARYVGAGGTACATATWDCWSVTSSGAGLSFTSIAIDPSGVATVSYQVITGLNFGVARFVRAGGSGCSVSSAWSCTAVDTSNDVWVILGSRS